MTNLALFQYQKNEPYLKAVAMRYTRDIVDAEDLLQDTVFKIFSKFHQFTPDTNFKSWAHTIMRNIFINKYRAKKKRPTLNVDNQGFFESLAISLNDGVRRLTEDEIMLSIQRLQPKSQEVLQYILKGYRYDEIADELVLPLGTIKSRIYFARKELKTELEKQNKIYQR